MIVEIKVNKSLYKVECSEIEKNKIINNANKLDYQIKKLTQVLGNVDEKTLLILNSLMMQEEINNLIAHKNSKETSSDNVFSEDEMLDEISQNIDNINSYIEKLTNRVLDY
jgi:cell division protein ZapA (FtsZ GTPase activity inhibitor)